jgi:LPS-assembly protein
MMTKPMKRLYLLICVLLAGLYAGAPPALAQNQIPGLNSKQGSIEVEGDRYRLLRDVEIEGETYRIFADVEVEYFADTGRLVAAGNVTLTSADSHISAERLEFDTRTQTGVFYNASGSASLGDRVDRSMFGSQEADVYFYGEKLEKLGATRYRITRGGFTTCVQPTPRWEVTSGSVVINLNEYAFLKHSLFRVKGLPVLYLPVLYYPMKEEGRATGFLLPVYGNSTIRGHSVSNAFFWAIGRSHDATLFHDYFARTGQGMGGEYRYVTGQGSQGNTRMYFLGERETVFGTADGEQRQPARRSFDVSGAAVQALPFRLSARGQINYFSNLQVQQLYHQDIRRISQRQRSYGASVSRNWAAYSFSGTFDRRETFQDDTSSVVHGSVPRISLGRAERPLTSRAPLYFSLGSEYVQHLRSWRSGSFVSDTGLGRFDVSPVLRFPFTRWQFLTLNSSLRWRGTYYSASQDEQSRARLDDNLLRRYFELESRVSGPVLNRIWNTPDSRYAEKLKHTVEPFVSVRWVSSIDNFDRILTVDGTDTVVGGVTTLAYGMNHRLYAKPPSLDGTAAAREIASLAVMQTYHTDERAARFDRDYHASFTGAPASNFTPISVLLRTNFTEGTDATFRTEYDTRFGAFLSFSANGTMRLREWLQSSAGWTQRRRVPGLHGAEMVGSLDHYLNADTSIRLDNNRFGGAYSFNYDFARSQFMQQRFIGYFNAQCCGFAVEYQVLNTPWYRVPQDRRFNFSFTLAGIGTFSNPLGAMGGGQR